MPPDRQQECAIAPDRIPEEGERPRFRGRSPSIFPCGKAVSSGHAVTVQCNGPDRPKSMALVQFNAMTPVPAVRWRQFSSEGCYLPHQPPSGPAGRRQEPTLRSGTPRLAAVDPKQPECYHQHRDPHDVERPGIEKSNRTTAHPVTQRPDLAQRPDQSRCQATVKTDPPATVKTDPLGPREESADEGRMSARGRGGHGHRW